MRSFFIGLSAFAAISSANAATSINFQPGGDVLSPELAIFETFDSYQDGSWLASNAMVYADSVIHKAARPAVGSSGNFLTVLGSPDHGSYTVNFDATSMFSFAFGSADAANAIRLLYADESFQDYIGAQITNGLTLDSGNQISGETNGRVTYTVTSGPLLTGVRFSSIGNAMEIDNLAIAIGVVPEPTTWAFMIVGFGVVGASLRGRRHANKASLVN